MTVSEAYFKKKFCQELKKLGCTPLQYMQNGVTVRGFPDTIVLLPESVVVFIEFKKSRTAKYQPGQKEWQQRLRDRGYFAWVCYPENAEQVLKEIKEIL